MEDVVKPGKPIEILKELLEKEVKENEDLKQKLETLRLSIEKNTKFDTKITKNSIKTEEKQNFFQRNIAKFITKPSISSSLTINMDVLKMKVCGSFGMFA